jgi:hypothetical protein
MCCEPEVMVQTYTRGLGQHEGSGKHYVMCVFYMFYAYHLFYISKLLPLPTITENIFLYTLIFHVDAEQHPTYAVYSKGLLMFGGLNLWLLITICLGVPCNGRNEKKYKRI